MAEPPRIWKTGERCVLTYWERSLHATVTLASGNGRSLMLSFDGILGGMVGSMPVLWEPVDRCFRDLVLGNQVKLEEVPRG